MKLTHNLNTKEIFVSLQDNDPLSLPTFTREDENTIVFVPPRVIGNSTFAYALQEQEHERKTVKDKLSPLAVSFYVLCINLQLLAIVVLLWQIEGKL